MFCSNCGKKLNDDDRFCDECGSAVYEEPVAVPPAAADPNPELEQNIMKKMVCIVVLIMEEEFLEIL